MTLSHSIGESRFKKKGEGGSFFGLFFAVLICGEVDGNIEAEGNTGLLGVCIAGSVTGNLKETGTGDVSVHGPVHGNIDQQGDGSVTVTPTGVLGIGPCFVDGNITEKDAGEVIIDPVCTVVDNVDES